MLYNKLLLFLLDAFGVPFIVDIPSPLERDKVRSNQDINSVLSESPERDPTIKRYILIQVSNNGNILTNYLRS
jgi:hypothetical protein